MVNKVPNVNLSTEELIKLLDRAADNASGFAPSYKPHTLYAMAAREIVRLVESNRQLEHEYAKLKSRYLGPPAPSHDTSIVG